MDALSRLVAIEEIRQLIARYAIAFDDYDWETLAGLWDEDAVFVAPGMSYEGRDSLIEFLSTCLPPDYHGKHMNSPALIEIGPDGTSATAKTDVVWVTENFENTIVGRYDDTFTNTDGRWLFLRRSESLIEFKPGPPPMSDAARAASGNTVRSA